MTGSILKATPEEMAAWLRSLDAAELVGVLMDEATRDPAVERRLRERAARDAADGGSARELQHAFDRAAFVRDHVPYREAWGYAEGIGEVIDRFEQLLAAGGRAAVIELAEHALRTLEDLVGMVDDSDGETGVLRDRLLDLHLAACRAARPEPLALAGRLFTWELRSDWDLFHGAARDYADVLGAAGLAEYRRQAGEVWRTIPALGPGDTRGYRADDEAAGRPSRFAITAIMEVLADLAGDIDGRIAVMERDLSGAYRFLEIAEVCRAADRMDAASEWAERGVREFPVHTDPRLRRFLADRYQEQGRHADALALAWATFIDRPGRDSHRELRDVATIAEAWPEWQARAIEHAGSLIDARDDGTTASGGSVRPALDARWDDWDRGTGASLLVELLLADGRSDDAWAAATEHGCRRGAWLELARARETDHPADAALVYRREVEALIGEKRNDGYRRAVDLMRLVARLMEAAGEGAGVRSYVTEVMMRHKRKWSFIDLLDRARIGR